MPHLIVPQATQINSKERQGEFVSVEQVSIPGSCAGQGGCTGNCG